MKSPFVWQSERLCALSIHIWVFLNPRRGHFRICAVKDFFSYLETGKLIATFQFSMWDFFFLFSLLRMKILSDSWLHWAGSGKPQNQSQKSNFQFPITIPFARIVSSVRKCIMIETWLNNALKALAAFLTPLFATDTINLSAANLNGRKVFKEVCSLRIKMPIFIL